MSPFLHACLFVSCDSPKQEQPSANSPNVLLILVDTLRADKLGCSGNKLGLSPQIDALAKEGAWFSQAFSHAPWTLPSMASLMTSTYPEIHGAGQRRRVGQFHFTGINPALKTLAECFKKQGYDTSAIVNVTFMSPTFGFDRGFDAYDFVRPKHNQEERRAKEVTDLAIRQLHERKDAARPFFLLVHYFDPHLTYDPPEPFRRRFAEPLDRDPAPPLFGTEGDMIRLRRGQIRLRDVPVKRLERLYNGEIASTDEEIGRLLSELRKMGMDETTIVAFTSDHGEEFLDHGGFEHGDTLYDELIHVPLIIRYPHVIQPDVVGATVGHIDLAPTLCELAGIVPASSFVGRSLLPLIDHKKNADRPILSQGNMWGPSWTSWRQGGYKLIQGPSGVHLFHVAVDPLENLDIFKFTSQKQRLEKMQQDMQLAIKAAKQRAVDIDHSPIAEMTKDEIERLRALGYFGDTNGQDDDSVPKNNSTPTSQPNR